MNSKLPCYICQRDAVHPLLDFGLQALSNRFLAEAEEPETAFPFVLGQCFACGLVQLIRPVPAAELKARLDWITYNEAEGHLDELVARACSLPGINQQSTIGAISFKDDSTIARFRARDFTNTWRLQLTDDLEVADICAGLETVQDRLSPERAITIAQKHGAADVLVVRHILEHAHDPHQFAAALRFLVKPEGCLIFEVPDCNPALSQGDYTMPWEEHICYFTPDLFAQSLRQLGFEIIHQDCYPYANENSLVVMVRAAKEIPALVSGANLTEKLKAVAANYQTRFASFRQLVVEKLSAYRKAQGPIAVFGAGHLSCAWINFLGLENLVDLVVDDHPRKIGMFMPGSRLPVCASAALLERDIRLCLTSLSAESEAKVKAKQKTFLQQGGRFVSIFPGRDNSFVTFP